MAKFRNLFFALAGTVTVLALPSSAEAADFQRYLNGTCAVNSVCNIDFPNVPAGKTLRLANLSCYIRFNQDNDLYGAQLLLVNNSTGGIALAITPSLVTQGFPQASPSVTERVYVSNDTIKAVAVSGQHFRAYAEVRNSSGGVASISQYACHISGSLN
jgi:hypothetical protein